jgi:hypothetical protein
MSNVLDTLKTILSKELPEDQAQAFINELTYALGQGSVEISKDATGSVIVTGSNNIVGDNNQIVINQSVNSEELVKNLRQLIKRNGDQNIHVGNIYTGATPEQIRFIIKELTFQTSHPDQSFNEDQGSNSYTDNPSFSRLHIDPKIAEAINSKLEMIEEIRGAGYLPVIQESELSEIKQHLQKIHNLNQDLQTIVERSDRIIQEAVAIMRLQLDSFNLAGTRLVKNVPGTTSTVECQQAEAKIFTFFSHGIEDSRLGADWMTKNMDSLIKYAHRKSLQQSSNSNISEEMINDFDLSLKHFLEQIIFSLYWGSYEILDTPEIPLIFGVEQYKFAFQSMKEIVSPRLRSETIQAIEECLDYLINRLSFNE